MVDAKGNFDDVHPFHNPLNIRNPSAIFDMHEVNVTCEFAAMWGNGVPSRGVDGHNYKMPLITSHDPFVFISEFGSSFYFGQTGAAKSISLRQGLIIVNISYETWFHFWIIKIRWPREHSTYLNFVPGPAPHWISGRKIL